MSKAGKKKFSDGLDSLIQRSLFDESHEAAFDKQRTAGNAKKATKSLLGHLEQFIQDSIEESVEEKAKAIRKGEPITDKSSKPRKAFSGIDLLIQNTIEESQVMESTVKRITFTFDKEKIEKLKSIADTEKARIRDIVDQLVTDYISKYSL